MKGYKHLTPEQRQAILTSYERTQCVTATATELGLGHQRVAYAIRQAGLPLTGSKMRAYFEHEEELRQLAAEGLPLSEIARRTGLKRQRVHRFLDEQGIPHRDYRGGGQLGEYNAAWKGGRIVDKDGYVLVCQPDHPHADRHGYVREHRLVMEKHLGRYLSESEVVHHREPPKTDNRFENLVLFESNAEHLGATLKGQVPQWSPEGMEKMRGSPRLSAMLQGIASRDESESDGRE